MIAASQSTSSHRAVASIWPSSPPPPSTPTHRAFTQYSHVFCIFNHRMRVWAFVRDLCYPPFDFKTKIIISIAILPLCMFVLCPLPFDSKLVVGWLHQIRYFGCRNRKLISISLASIDSNDKNASSFRYLFLQIEFSCSVLGSIVQLITFDGTQAL